MGTELVNLSMFALNCGLLPLKSGHLTTERWVCIHFYISSSYAVYNALYFRDFAYVARDPSTGKHKCHMFRCHGNISGRAITNALHDMCSKILEEKKKAQESTRKISAQKPWSDIINTPPPSSARGTSLLTH